MSRSQFSNNSIDTVVTSINEVVNDAARKCFATKNCKNNKNHHRNSRRKRWFDKDCEEAKKLPPFSKMMILLIKIITEVFQLAVV